MESTKEKGKRVSYIVFFLTLAVVVINLVSVFFPALILTLTGGLESQINPFEPGFLAFPLLVANAVVFSIWYMYYRTNLPQWFQKPLKFILNFEISRKVAAVVIVILLGGYVAFTVQELGIDEKDEWGDFEGIEEALKDFPFGEEGKKSLKVLYVKNFFLHSSQTIFQNVKVIPFIASISLLLLTYFFTVQVSKKRFPGVIAMVILLQSSTFLRYDTTATYSNFWTLFFVLSLYLIYKGWYLSPVSYFASIFSKPLTAIFLPMVLFFTYKAEIPRRKKIHITITYVVITVVFGIAGVSILGESTPVSVVSGTLTSFSNEDFWSGFTTWSFQLRGDDLVLLFILPLTVGLFVVSRKGVPEADSILIMIFGILLSVPLLAAFTGFNLHPYRYVPLIVFFAIGVGTLLSKRITQQSFVHLE